MFNNNFDGPNDARDLMRRIYERRRKYLANVPLSQGGRRQRDTTGPVGTFDPMEVEEVTEAFTLTITWDEPVFGFTVDSLTLTNCTASDFTQVDDLTYTVLVTPTWEGDLAWEIEAGACTDAAGNPCSGVGPGAGGSILPLDIDFSVLADGPLPSPLVGATWAVSGGKAVNTPTLGEELLADPGLEANYTDGKCDTLTKGGSPTLAESADAHGGSKAQQFTATAGGNNLRYPSVTGVPGTWYQASAWAKRTAGSSAGGTRLRVAQSGQMPAGAIEQSHGGAATYTQVKVSIVAGSDNALYIYPVFCNSTSFDTLIVDDGSFKAIADGSVFALLPATSADVALKVKLPDSYAGFADGTHIGLIVRADSQTNPQNYIAALFRPHPGGTSLGAASLFQRVGNTFTSLIAETLVTIRDAYLEVRASGDTISLWYNNTQIGTDQTVDDPALVANRFHGVASAGGNSLNRFFLGHQLTDMSLVFAGSSFTQANPGYKALIQQWLMTNHPQYAFTFESQAMGGRNSWSNLVKLQTGADVFVIDHANDSSDPVASPARMALEAIIRRLWTANPDTRIIIMGSPTWIGKDTSDNEQVHTPTNAVAIAQIKALAEHYGCGYVDYPQWCIDVVTAGTYDLNELTTDTVHPSNTAGYPGMAALLQEFLPLGGGSKPAVMPERLYDDGSYENEPVVILGTDYDSRTGTGWSDDGTATESSTEGDTITYSATCQSFGLRRLDARDHTNLEISVDGGAWRNSACNANGEILPEGRGAHTITIRLKAGGNVRIDEFWAV